MEKVVIDRESCNGCGLCIPVCPDRTLAKGDGGVIVAGERCMECGHCQAVCPNGAVSIQSIESGLGLQHISEKPGVLQPGDYDVAKLVHLMRSRRSCRNFKSVSVELSLLHDLVKIGTTAPSGTNSQLWNFTLLPTREDVVYLGDLVAKYFRAINVKAANPFCRLMSDLFMGGVLSRYYRRYFMTVSESIREYDEEGIDRLFHGAQAAVLVTVDSSASCPGEDALLASQNILLAAHALGLGTCLIGFAVEAIRRRKDIRQMMGILTGEEVYAVIALGYPDEQYSRVAGRKKIRPRIIKKN